MRNRNAALRIPEGDTPEGPGLSEEELWELDVVHVYVMPEASYDDDDFPDEDFDENGYEDPDYDLDFEDNDFGDEEYADDFEDEDLDGVDDDDLF